MQGSRRRVGVGGGWVGRWVGGGGGARGVRGVSDRECGGVG